MKFSNEVPELRLKECIEKIKVIYDGIGRDTVSKKPALEICHLMGYRSNVMGGPLQKPLKALAAFGLLDSSGKYNSGYNVTKLGEQVNYADTPLLKAKARKQAFENFSLWRVLYSKYGKKLPANPIFVDIYTTLNISTADAQEMEHKIRQWYNADVDIIDEEILAQDTGNGDEKIEVLDAHSTSKVQTQGGNFVVIHYAGKHHDIPIEDHSQRPIIEAILADLWNKISKQPEPEPEPVKESENEIVDGQTILT